MGEGRASAPTPVCYVTGHVVGGHAAGRQAPGWFVSTDFPPISHRHVVVEAGESRQGGRVAGCREDCATIVVAHGSMSRSALVHAMPDSGRRPSSWLRCFVASALLVSVACRWAPAGPAFSYPKPRDTSSQAGRRSCQGGAHRLHNDSLSPVSQRLSYLGTIQLPRGHRHFAKRAKRAKEA